MFRSLYALLSLLVLVLFVGCPSPSGDLGDDDDVTPPGLDDDDATDDDDDDDDTADDDDTTPAPVEVAAVFPEDGSEGHYVNSPIWVDFTGVPTEATVSLVDTDGTNWAGTQTWVGPTRLLFESTDTLTHSATYTASASWDDVTTEPHSWSFTTSTLGDTPTAADLTGSTFAVDITTGTLVAPPGAEDFLGSFNAMFLLGVESQTETELDLMGSLAVAKSDPPEQDLCSATFDLNQKADTTWTDPYIEAGPADVPQSFTVPTVGDINMTFRDMQIAGVFTSSNGDGVVDTISEASFYTVLDIRDAGLGDVCDQLGALGIDLTCVTCPHDLTSEQCVIFQSIGLTGSLVDGLTLVPWNDKDVAANPDCD